MGDVAASGAFAAGVLAGHQSAECHERGVGGESVTNGYSNSRSEGLKRLAKHVGRDAVGFRTPSTKDAGYGGPAPAKTGGCQPGTSCCPVKFEEPVKFDSLSLDTPVTLASQLAHATRPTLVREPHCHTQTAESGHDNRPSDRTTLARAV